VTLKLLLLLLMLLLLRAACARHDRPGGTGWSAHPDIDRRRRLDTCCGQAMAQPGCADLDRRDHGAGVIGLNITPLRPAGGAGAGVSLGAQTLIKDIWAVLLSWRKINSGVGDVGRWPGWGRGSAHDAAGHLLRDAPGSCTPCPTATSHHRQSLTREWRRGGDLNLDTAPTWRRREALQKAAEKLQADQKPGRC